jgi:hypothetical protein
MMAMAMTPWRGWRMPIETVVGLIRIALLGQQMMYQRLRAFIFKGAIWKTSKG